MDSFLKWMGGKSQLRHEIVPLIPAHKTYVEPFGGAGWVLFGKPPSPAEFINDIDSDLVNLWLVVRDHLDEFREYLEGTPISEALFTSWCNCTDLLPAPVVDPTEVYASRPTSSSSRRIPDVAMAARTYYVVKNAFNGIMGSNPSFSVNTGRESAFTTFYSTDWPRISERLKRVTIMCKDFKEVIETLDGPDSFFYLDPPYLCTLASKKYYRHRLTLKDHQVLSVYLKDIKGSFLLSYGDDPRVREWYKDFHIIPSQQAQGELFILNYEPPQPPFYSSCSPRIRDGYQDGRAAQRIPERPEERKAPWMFPNCPHCGSRRVKWAWERITFEEKGKVKKSWIHSNLKCVDCRRSFDPPGGPL